MRKFLFALFLIVTGLAPLCAHAQDSTSVGSVFKVWVGANAAFNSATDSLDKFNDVEVGLTSAANLYHPISVVASGFVGVDKQYVYGSIGPRIALSDSTAHSYGTAISFERQFSSDETFKQNEWVAKASVAFRPWPTETPQVVLGAQGFYGISSNTAGVSAALRYQIGRK